MSQPEPPAYASFAPIYDATGLAATSVGVAALALGLLRERGQVVGSALDLACGTGAAALRLAESGARVTAIDRSPAMLAIARARARDARLPVTFIEGDIRRLLTTGGAAPRSPVLRRPSSIDLITCLGDSLSELTDEGDLGRVLAASAALLRPSGHICFDVRTPAEHAAWDARDEVLRDDGGMFVYARRDYNPRTRLATSRVVWFVREVERWWRGEETIVARSWSDAELRAALASAGLTLEARLTRDGAPATDDAPWVVYLARR